MATESDKSPAKGTLQRLLGNAKEEAVAARAVALANGAIIPVPLELLEDNPWQPRIEYDEQKMEELTAAIADAGLLQNPLVRRVGARFQIIAGHRRIRAIRRLHERAVDETNKRKWASVPCQEKADATDDQMEEWALLENIQREDLTPLDAAAAIDKLRERRNLDVAQIAERMKIEPDRVKRLLALNRAPDVIKQGCGKGIMVPVLDGQGGPVLSGGGKPRLEHRRLDLLAALELAKLFAIYSKKTDPKRAAVRLETVVKRVLTQQWTFKTTERFVKAVREGKPEGEIEVAAPKLFERTEAKLSIRLDRIGEAEPDQKVALRAQLDEVRERLSRAS